MIDLFCQVPSPPISDTPLLLSSPHSPRPRTVAAGGGRSQSGSLGLANRKRAAQAEHDLSHR